MKANTTCANVLLLAAAFAIMMGANAQSTTEGKKYHISIIKEENGGKQVIDRTFVTREELDAFVKENKIDVPALPETAAVEPATTGDKKAHKSVEKKKIVILEKQESDAGGKTLLNITSEDLTAQERANLIQEFMNMKGSNIQVKQVQGTSATSTQGKMVVVEAAGNTGNTEVSISSDELTAEERANLIQEMMGMKNSSVEIKQDHSTAATPGTSEVSTLQLFPNPNNGQFHISFKTEKPTDVQLRMIDTNGREVYTETVRGNSGNFDKDVNLRPAVSTGNYILEAVANGQKITTRVVVQ